MKGLTFRYWSSRYLVVLGVLWLVLEPAGLFIDELSDLGWYGFLAINVLSGLLASILFRSPTCVSTTLPESQTRIVVSVSDLLDQEGSIVIGTNDTFDTELGEIVSPTSVQGQFQSRIYSSDQRALDSDLQRALSTLAPDIDIGKSFGKRERYPIGTVACLPRNNNRYFLLVYCRMLPEKRVEADIDDLWFCLQACWKSIRDHGQYSDVHIPVIGTRFARTGLSWNLMIQLIVVSFILSLRAGKTAPSLTIHVSGTDLEHVDFVLLQDWLNAIRGR